MIGDILVLAMVLIVTLFCLKVVQRLVKVLVDIKNTIFS